MFIYALKKNNSTGEISFGFLCIARSEKDIDLAEKRAINQGFEILKKGYPNEFSDLAREMRNKLDLAAMSGARKL